jgi:hypothetical protein
VDRDGTEINGMEIVCEYGCWEICCKEIGAVIVGGVWIGCVDIDGMEIVCVHRCLEICCMEIGAVVVGGV